MAEVHIVSLRLVKVRPGLGTDGEIIEPNARVLTTDFETQTRVVPDLRLPNTAGFPTITRYLELEAVDDFVLTHFDQSFIITGFDPITLDASDIQIGAVEIKDHDSETRVDVSAVGAPSGNGMHVFAYSDAAGAVRYGLVDAQRRVTVSPIPGQIGVAAAAGAVDALTQRITLANNDPAVVSLGVIEIAVDPITTFHHTAVAAPGTGIDAVYAGNMGTAIVHIVSGAITSATIYFYLGNGGAEWVRVLARKIDTNEEATETSIAGVSNEMWEVPIGGAADLRVEINAIVPAAGTVTIYSRAIVGAAVKDSILRAMAAEGVAAPALVVQNGGKYEIVPSPIADGEIGALSIDAYKRLLNPSFNGATSSDQITDVSPVSLARQPLTVRASAALAAVGAYDTPIEIPTAGMGYLAIPAVYTRGAVNGGVRVRVEFADTVAGVDYWGRLPIINTGVFASGTDAYDGIQRREFDYYATAATAETFRVIVPLAGADKVRISVREIGVTATPGTCALYGKFSNQPIENQAAADSKAYTPTTDSLRVENITPEAYIYVDEPLGVNSVNIAGPATYYYPSSAGGQMGPYNKITADFTVSGGVTVTFEVSFDNGVIWKDITLYMIDLQTSLDGTASFVDTSASLYNIVNAPLWRMKYVTIDATNDIEISVRRKA